MAQSRLTCVVVLAVAFFSPHLMSADASTETAPHAALRGRVALMRGPIVYCLEGVDHDSSILSVALPRKSPVTAEHRKDLLGGVTVLLARGLTEGEEPRKLTAIPYYAWQNRGIDEMTVWIVEAE